jgi:hypothetical protein
VSVQFRLDSRHRIQATVQLLEKVFAAQFPSGHWSILLEGSVPEGAARALHCAHALPGER